MSANARFCELRSGPERGGSFTPPVRWSRKKMALWLPRFLLSRVTGIQSPSQAFFMNCAKKGGSRCGRRSSAQASLADGSLTILPGSLGAETQTDGFFIAILEKQG
jgi:hypothetical protein